MSEEVKGPCWQWCSSAKMLRRKLGEAETEVARLRSHLRLKPFFDRLYHTAVAVLLGAIGILAVLGIQEGWLLYIS